jgi:hypothetical protein
MENGRTAEKNQAGRKKQGGNGAACMHSNRLFGLPGGSVRHQLAPHAKEWAHPTFFRFSSSCTSAACLSALKATAERCDDG